MQHLIKFHKIPGYFLAQSSELRAQGIGGIRLRAQGTGKDVE
jgi:hypothetical protein